MYFSDNNNFAALQHGQENDPVFAFSLWYLAPRSLALEVFKSRILLPLQLPQVHIWVTICVKLWILGRTASRVQIQAEVCWRGSAKYQITAHVYPNQLCPYSTVSIVSTSSAHPRQNASWLPFRLRINVLCMKHVTIMQNCAALRGIETGRSQNGQGKYFHIPDHIAISPNKNGTMGKYRLRGRKKSIGKILLCKVCLVTCGCVCRSRIWPIGVTNTGETLLFDWPWALVKPQACSFCLLVSNDFTRMGKTCSLHSTASRPYSGYLKYIPISYCPQSLSKDLIVLVLTGPGHVGLC